METDQNNAVWAMLIPTGLVLLCCAGPLLVAVASAGAFGAVASWFKISRASWLATTALLAAVALYAGRRRRAACCAPVDHARADRARRLSIAAWTGAGLALLAVGLSLLVAAR